VVSFTHRPLYSQGKSPWYPLDRKIGGPQSRCGRDGEEKNSQPPPEIEPSNSDPVLKKIVWEVVNWIHLAQDTYQWRSIMNTVVNLPIP
jgi:hypothetical protein